MLMCLNKNLYESFDCDEEWMLKWHKATPRQRLHHVKGCTTSKATPRQRLHHVKGYTTSKATPRQRLHHVKGYTTSKATPRQRLHHVKGYTTSKATPRQKPSCAGAKYYSFLDSVFDKQFIKYDNGVEGIRTEGEFRVLGGIEKLLPPVPDLSTK